MPASFDANRAQGCLQARDAVEGHPSSLEKGLMHARRAQALSSRAFYNPSLLGLLYFPVEHRYAIYTPLFGPLAVPLLASAVREVTLWRKRRKEKQNGQEKEKQE